MAVVDLKWAQVIDGDSRRRPGISAKALLFLPHAIRQMARPQRMITSDEVDAVVTQGELIEDYPNDRRGHSCVWQKAAISLA